jgi:hypothetical protein
MAGSAWQGESGHGMDRSGSAWQSGLVIDRPGVAGLGAAGSVWLGGEWHGRAGLVLVRHGWARARPGSAGMVWPDPVRRGSSRLGEAVGVRLGPAGPGMAWFGRARQAVPNG